MLEKVMSIINNPDDLRDYIGGSTPPNTDTDCVINAFDYLDGSTENYFMYETSMMLNLGYNTTTPNSSGGPGGVKIGGLVTVGSYGGLTVTSFDNTDTSLISNDGTVSSSSGSSGGGDNIMLVFNSGDGGHAVVWF